MVITAGPSRTAGEQCSWQAVQHIQRVWLFGISCHPAPHSFISLLTILVIINVSDARTGS